MFTLSAISCALGTLCLSPFCASGSADASWPCAVLLAAGLTAAVVLVYMYMASHLGADSFEQTLSQCFCPFLSRITLVVIGALLTAQTALTAYITTDAIGMYLLEHTPRGAILLAVLFTACVVQDSGLKYALRCCELLLMLISVPLVILLVICLLNTDVGEIAVLLQPKLSSVISQLPAALVSCGGGAAVTFAACRSSRNACGAVCGFGCSAAVSVLLFICTAGVFTADGAALLKFPYIEMARSVSIGSISLTERFDAVFICIMFTAAIAQAALLGGCASRCFSSAFELRREQSFVWLLLPIIFVLAYYSEYRSFCGALVQGTLCGTVLLFLLPTALTIGHIIRKGDTANA